MKRKLFFILTTAVLLICTACSGSFIDPGMLDQPGGGLDLGDDDIFGGGGSSSGGGGTSSKPATPKGVKASATSSSSITITWNEVSGAVYYSVYRSTSSSGEYTSIGGWVFSTSYTDTGLSANTTYYYKVSAVNSAGESTQSSSVSVTTSAPTTVTKPSAPTSVTATALSSSSIRISWTAVQGATSYKVYRGSSTSSQFTNNVGTVDGNGTTSYTDNTGLSANTTYYYKVSAVNTAGEGDKSSPYASVKTLAK